MYYCTLSNPCVRGLVQCLHGPAITCSAETPWYLCKGYRVHVPVWLEYPHVHIVRISARACIAKISARAYSWNISSCLYGQNIRMCYKLVEICIKKKKVQNRPLYYQLCMLFVTLYLYSLTGGWVGGVRGGGPCPQIQWASLVIFCWGFGDLEEGGGGGGGLEDKGV